MIQPPFETAETLKNLSQIRHGFFGRRGADNDTLGLDMSEILSGDLDRIAANRRAALTAMGAGNMPLAALTQVHSAGVITLDMPPDPGARPQADGLVTNRPGIALGILTADCTPVLFADPQEGVIGACHAGWKGAVNGVLQNTLAAMVKLGARANRTIAAIGPTISGANYEVGPEFAASIMDLQPRTKPHIFTPDNATREHFDLPGFVRAELDYLGLATAERVGGCTFDQPARYFSHRHHMQRHSPAGRQISLIAIAA